MTLAPPCQTSSLTHGAPWDGALPVPDPTGCRLADARSTSSLPARPAFSPFPYINCRGVYPSEPTRVVTRGDGLAGPLGCG